MFGHQNIPSLSFVLLLQDQRHYVGWVLISARSVENCISVEKINTSNIEVQSIIQKLRLVTLLKEESSAEIFNPEIFKNTFFTEHLWTNASVTPSKYCYINIFLD